MHIKNNLLDISFHFLISYTHACTQNVQKQTDSRFVTGFVTEFVTEFVTGIKKIVTGFVTGKKRAATSITAITQKCIQI